MDNLTHTITGLMLGRAGLNRYTRYAPLTLLLSANAPDFDAVSLVGGQEAHFYYHRWLTHAIVAVPFMAAFTLLCVAGLRWGWNRSRWKPRALAFLSDPLPLWRVYGLCLLGVASHLLLDWTNAYGIRLYLPWSDAWPSLDATHVIDLWIWAAALLALGGPSLSRLVSSEIGARPTSGRGWAIFFLLFIAFNSSARFILSRRAVAVQEARMYNGLTPRKVLVFPTPANPFRWGGFVETDSFWVVQDVNLLTEFDPTLGRLLYKPELTPAFTRAAATRPFNRLLRFSKGVTWQVLPAADANGADIISVTDIRFGFQAVAELENQNRVGRSWFHY